MLQHRTCKLHHCCFLVCDEHCVWDCIAVYVLVHEGGPVLLWRLSQQGPFSAMHPPCVFPNVCVSCAPDCVYSAACVQSLVGKGQGRTGLTCMLFPFFLPYRFLSLSSLKYRLNLSSVFSLSIRECMFRIIITISPCALITSLQDVFILKWWLDSKAAINYQEQMKWIQY